MSMDELLLQELYGSQQAQADEQVKQAQIELVEAVAAEAGVDLNELDDDELSKFAHYVLSDEDEEQSADAAEASASELEVKLAEADLVGRQMAISYLDQINAQTQNGDDMSNHTFTKVAAAMNDVADAWYQEKIATGATGASADAATAAAPGRIRAAMDLAKRYPGRTAAGLAAAGGLIGGGLALRARRRRNAAAMMEQQAKESSFNKVAELANAGYTALAIALEHSPEEFAKEAEFRAAEILIANGIDPETLTDIEPAHVKIASFPEVEDAIDDAEYAELAEYNEMLDTAAMHIIESLLN